MEIRPCGLNPAEESSTACCLLSEGRLPFRIAAGPVLALSFSGPAVLTNQRPAALRSLREGLMSTKSNREGFKLSLDTWAVILALALALAVRANLFNKIPW
jgi:hypothetical protein